MSVSHHTLTFHHYTFISNTVITDILVKEHEISTLLIQKFTCRISHFTLQYALLKLFSYTFNTLPLINTFAFLLSSPTCLLAYNRHFSFQKQYLNSVSDKVSQYAVLQSSDVIVSHNYKFFHEYFTYSMVQNPS